MNTLYDTTDIVLAAFLRLQNVNLAEIRKEGSRGTFVFNIANQEEFNALRNTFDLGIAQVEPVAFNNMIKQLTTAVRRL